MMESSSSPRNNIPSSDLDDDRLARAQQEDQIQQLLTVVGDYLHHADAELSQLERDDILGSAILRGCQEIGASCKHLAEQLDAQTEEQRRALAQACLMDAQNSLELYSNSNNSENSSSSHPKDLQALATETSETEMMKVLQLASELLKDVAASLSAIEQDEADELADVGLTVAQLFVASLQQIHSTITPQQILEAAAVTSASGENANRSRSVELLEESPNIERLDDEEETEDDQDQSSAEHTNRSTPTTTTTIPNNSQQKRKENRVRVLWPPLGPAVQDALKWGKDQAGQQPLLAAALGLTLWPAAVVTTIVGTPLVLVDGFIQDLYSNFHDAPLLVGVEQSAAQLFQTGKLSFICSKLVAKQTLRVVKRQVDRHGGPQQIAHNVGEMALDRILHPIETIGMAWNGVCFGIGAVQDLVHQLQDDSERDENVQLLQQ